MQGWVKIHRDLLDNELWSDKPFTKGQAWIDLLLLANHRDKNALLGNRTELVERGSLITSELKLMERWGWGRKKVKLFLNFLESQKMIERNANNKRTAITIVNYGFYQDCDLEKEQQRNSKGTTQGQHRDSKGTAKEHKQERKKERRKKYIDTDVSIMQHSISAIIDAWNQLEPYGIKMIYRIKPGSKRCTSLTELINRFGEEKVIDGIDKVKASEFLQGKTDARFSLNFDWFINPSNFEKILDGKYAEKFKKPTKNNNNFERRQYDMDDLESKLLGR